MVNYHFTLDFSTNSRSLVLFFSKIQFSFYYTLICSKTAEVYFGVLQASILDDIQSISHGLNIKS